MCNFGSFNGGVPIPDFIHFQFSTEVQGAWETFNNWWKEQNLPISRKDMPKNVAEAMELILKTPIPTYEEEGYTGEDSCYMKGVLSLMEE